MAVGATSWPRLAILIAALAIVAAAKFRVSITVNVGDVSDWEPDNKNKNAGFGDGSAANNFGLTEEGLQKLKESLASYFGISVDDIDLTDVDVDEDGDVTFDFETDVDLEDRGRNVTDLEGEYVGDNDTPKNFTVPVDEDTPIDIDKVSDDHTILIVIICCVIGGVLIIGVTTYVLVRYYKNKKADAVSSPNKLPDSRDRKPPPTTSVTNNTYEGPGQSQNQPSKPEVITPRGQQAPPSNVANEPLPGAAEDDVEAQRDGISPKRAQYRWNASANAISDPPPGGDVPVAKMADTVTKAQSGGDF